MLQCQPTTATAATPPLRSLLSVKAFAAKYPEFPAPTLRDLIFKAEARHTTKGKLPGNGLLEAGAIIRCGRKILIDEVRFFLWLDRRNGIESNGRAAQ